ncbi:ABC transporter permease [Microbacterium halophytorum]|uniref:ABC transporter permease n=1 Tax=Microbacterium halophytorum TaxID=2067568 RepID=UPI000CFD9D8B|nr:ABC transporter permease [Microbacterium halophytorum]
MNPTYYRIEITRVIRDVVTMFFVAVLPAILYIIFGAVQSYGEMEFGNGNVAFYVMVGMAAYGAITATVGVGGTAAVEQMQGWGRQLGLTPMRDSALVLTKAGVGFTISLIPVAIIYAIGAFTGAEAEPHVWALSAAVVVLGAAVFSFYGLLAGYLFRSEGAVAAASGSLVILGFLGNVFFPLSGVLLEIARFTPLYGYVALARYPQTDGEPAMMGPPADEVPAADPLWALVLNLVLWASLFIVGTIVLARRGRARQ